MDKTAIKNFAIEARKILMKSAESRAGFYGITKDEISSPVQRGADFEIYKTVAGTDNRVFGRDIQRRRNLVNAINEKGFDQVIEETAYTWFNRIIAIRFMEVNDYLPTRMRVLSSETGGNTPDIISHYLEVELNLSSSDIEKIESLISNNKYDDAFKILFIKQCNELNDILPGLFEKTDDYMELLLDISYTGDGVVRMLIDDVAEDNFNVEKEGQVEIIGWLYQYYNTELKDDTFAKLKKNVKITKERIPAATQLFTPDWIVRYMVENSLGRVWIDHLRALDETADEKKLAESFGWKYYLPETEQEPEVASELVKIRSERKDLTPQDITCIDPCMGSGHILVYMFDVLLQIYESEGISVRDAVFDILEKNIHGLDIDVRAYQLSYFALMMKGRGAAGRRFFRGVENEEGNNRPVALNVYAIDESNDIDRSALSFLGKGMSEIEKNTAKAQVNRLLDEMTNAKEYGSIINVTECDWRMINRYLKSISTEGQLSLGYIDADYNIKSIVKLMKIAKIFAQKYDSVITNPPYMGNGGMSEQLSSFAKKNYPDSKSDMSTIFMERCLNFCQENGYVAMINIPVWMFLISFEKMRKRIVDNNIIINMIHPGRGIFGSDFGSVAFVLQQRLIENYRGVYCRLFKNSSEVEGVEQREQRFLDLEGRFYANQSNFKCIPGTPIAYWVSSGVYNSFNGKKISDYADARSGMSTTDNVRFLRLWFEESINNIKFDCESLEEAKKSKQKWYPYNKGGDFRKWYGNNAYVVNWLDDGAEVKYWVTHNPKDPKTTSWGRRIFATDCFFKAGITWSSVTIGAFSCRLYETGFIFDSGANGLFVFNMDHRYYVAGLLNSKVGNMILGIINPTVNSGPGSVGKIPVLMRDCEKVTELVKHNCDLSKKDWDCYEVSWDFERHPLVSVIQKNRILFDDIDNIDLAECFNCWENECNERFAYLKKNEEELNKIFIDIYGLQNELTPEVEDKNVTVRKADLSRDIKSLISYAVGCMFGRYSLNESGLVYAGGAFDLSKYSLFAADDDAIIPITDEEYFDDDIVTRFVEFIRIVYGNKALEFNLDFIAKALGNKGNTSREVIRNYFINDFFKDHCGTYSVTGSGKRPIYWLFDAGKQNGFKCLIYMHRYTPDTVGLIRSAYFRRTQDAIENGMKNAEYIIKSTSSAVEKATAKAKIDKYIKQLNEMRPYYQALTHIALQRINIDLDDGVKHNYQLFQGVEISGEGTKNQKIDLLAKI